MASAPAPPAASSFSLLLLRQFLGGAPVLPGLREPVWPRGPCGPRPRLRVRPRVWAPHSVDRARQLSCSRVCHPSPCPLHNPVHQSLAPGCQCPRRVASGPEQWPPADGRLGNNVLPRVSLHFRGPLSDVADVEGAVSPCSAALLPRSSATCRGGRPQGQGLGGSAALGLLLRLFGVSVSP